jgi:3-phosphoshikimate 1-carboxyvinyltransferase
VITVKPFHCNGNIKAHASKSYLQRALVIAMLADGESTLLNCGASADADAVIHAVKSLGAKVSGNGTLKISSATRDIQHDVVVSAVESGLALRMLATVVSLFSKNVTILGEGSLLKRPLKPLLDVLTEAGITYECPNCRLPLTIKGDLKSKFINIDASFSSQMLTGLLIAAPLAEHDTVILVSDAVSKPYIDMTLDIISHFGVKIEMENYQIIFQSRGNGRNTQVYHI